MVKLSVSHYFVNKDNRAPMRPHRETGELTNTYAYGAFENTDWMPLQIMEHIRRGSTISVATLKENWRHQKNFESSQIMGVDFDNGTDLDAVSNFDISRHAFLIYATPSSTPEAPRTRALFILDQPLTDMALYRKYVKRLMHYFGQAADEKCKDPVRIFHGSKDCEYIANMDARLPVYVLQTLDPHPDELVERREPVQPQKLDGDWSQYVQRAIADELAKVATATQGNRNDQLNKSAFALGELVASNWSGLTRSQVENMLLSAAPLAHDFTEAEARNTIKSGLDAGMNHPRPEPQKTVRIATSTNGSTVPAEPASLDFDDFVVSSDEEMSDYIDRLAKENIPPVQPLVIPFKVLHQFGGYGRVIMPGKLIGIAGRTGGGKTTFVDTIVDAWRKLGKHVLIYSPEWTPVESADRIGQRYGGPTMEEMYLWQVYKGEARNGAAGEYQGVELSSNGIRSGVKAANTVLAWPGKSYRIKRARLNLDQLLDGIEQTVTSYRAKGINIEVVVIDYVQVLKINARDGNKRTPNDAISLIKDLCIDLNLVGVVVSQVTKADSRAASANGEKKLLDESSAQFVRFDEMNLAFTLNLDYDDDDENRPSGTATINVVKNNIGNRGRVKVYVNLARLTWLDEKVETFDDQLDKPGRELWE